VRKKFDALFTGREIREKQNRDHETSEKLIEARRQNGSNTSTRTATKTARSEADILRPWRLGVIMMLSLLLVSWSVVILDDTATELRQGIRKLRIENMGLHLEIVELQMLSIRSPDLAKNPQLLKLRGRLEEFNFTKISSLKD